MTNDQSSPNILSPFPPLTDDCIICYEPLNQDSGCVTTKCGHKYCPACFVAHMNIDNKCAMCRTEIPMKKPESMKEYEGPNFLDDRHVHLIAELANSLLGYNDSLYIPRPSLSDLQTEHLIEEVSNTNRGSGRVPFSVPMSVMIREQEQLRREREELVRNGRTGGHWGVPWNPEGEEEIIS
jgi:hypothetical protein